MEESHPAETGSTPEEEIRALGFDPSQLTPQEQQELLELHRLWPDPALSV